MTVSWDRVRQMRPYRYLIVFACETVFGGLGFFAFSWFESARLERAATAVVRRQPISVIAGPALVSTYCKTCHSSGRSKVDFDEPLDAASLQRDRPAWTAALHLLRSREMPPTGVPQPSDDDRARLIEWIEHSLDDEILAAADPD